MIPELFEIPFFHITLKSYGLMMVIGFLFAVYLIRKLSRKVNQDPDHMTNAALFALVSGVIGARAFFVIHNWDSFKNSPLDIFAVWQGGLEFLGGVFLAIIVVLIYLLRYKVSVRYTLDVLAVGLMLGLAFGRVGCFLNGCCFGRPTACPVAVTFPYDSHCYNSQVRPNFSRNRESPYFDLPAQYFGYYNQQSDTWVQARPGNKYHSPLKPKDRLSDRQLEKVTSGEYKARPVIPTQWYSSINALILCAILYWFFCKKGKFKPGSTFALMLILYGPTRFFLESLRDDNPYEYGWWTIIDGLTISQNIGIYMAILGTVLMVVFLKLRPNTDIPQENNTQEPPERDYDTEDRKTAGGDGCSAKRAFIRRPKKAKK